MDLTGIELDDGALAMLRQLPLALDNDAVLARLIGETAWRAESITLWGRQFLQPRLSAWQGEKPYTYSGLTLAAQPFSALVQQIRHAVQEATGCQFHSVLLNYYSD